MEQLPDVGQANKVVLIVDDVPANIKIIGNFLRNDFGIKVATNAQAALNLLRLAPGPDFILLDIEMPEIDGIELCKMIRAEATLKEIPIIFVTANTDDEILALVFQVGGNDYIRKPVNKIELLTRIRAVLAQKELIEAKRLEEKLTGAMAMAGAVAHELGQPLQSILTFAELLIQELDTTDSRRELARMVAEQCLAIAEISKKVRKITTYSTKKYLGGTQIIDIDKSTSK